MVFNTLVLQVEMFGEINSPYDFNETFAKPFNWTFTGRPIAAARDHRPKTWKEKWVANREAAKALASMAL